MPEFVQFLAAMREQMSAELTRSDVLRALIWPNAGLLIALSGALFSHAPTWALIVLFGLLSVFMLLYAAFYIFFALTDPDALRSEKYKLQKIALEHGYYGDNHTGLIEAEIEPKKKVSKSRVALPKPEAGL